MRTGFSRTIRAGALLACFTLLTCAGAVARAALSGVAPGEGGDAKVSVTAEGFKPGNIVLRRGARTTITFVRQVADTCATEIVVEELGIRVALPLNVPVTVDVTPRSAGQYDYGCGGGVFRGTIMVR